MPRTEIIFDDTLDPANSSSSSFFRDATMLFMEAPNLTSPIPNQPRPDLEIDISLQIYLKPSVQQHVNLNLFLPNQFGTYSIIPIPLEYWGTGFNQQLILTSALATRAVVTAVFPDFQGQPEIEALKQELSTVNNKLDQLLFRTPPIPCC